MDVSPSINEPAPEKTNLPVRLSCKALITSKKFSSDINNKDAEQTARMTCYHNS